MVDTFDCPNTRLKQGDKGEKVTLLQTHLKTLKYYTSTIDGDFGPVTHTAVKQFQKDTGHTQDGVFGPKTCPDLNKKILEKNGITSTNTSNQTTTTTTTKTTTTSTKPTVKVDPFAPDTNKNVMKATEGNLHIDGIHLLISDITFNQGFKTGQWKSLDLMNGGQYNYVGNPVPRKYQVIVYLSIQDYNKLKNELYKMQNRICNVTGVDIENSYYMISINVAKQLLTHMKLTMDLTENIGA